MMLEQFWSTNTGCT